MSIGSFYERMEVKIMDQGNGTFKGYSSYLLAKKSQAENPLFGGIFTKGEVLRIKGSMFKVTQILQNGLKLKLLPREEDE